MEERSDESVWWENGRGFLDVTKKAENENQFLSLDWILDVEGT